MKKHLSLQKIKQQNIMTIEYQNREIEVDFTYNGNRSCRIDISKVEFEGRNITKLVDLNEIDFIIQNYYI